MLSHDAALTYLIAQHTQEQAAAFLKQEIVTVKVSMSPTPSKKLIAKGEPALVHSKPGLPGITMPDRGTLDARAFLKAILHAGRRQSETGAMFTDALEVRNDQIKAIHAFFYETRNGVKVYVGYSPTGSFGSQEVAARALAMREIKGAPSVSHLPPPSRSMGGYVAGLPNMRARQFANLRGQETLATDAYIAALNAKDERAALIESERLKSIQAQIDALL